MDSAEEVYGTKLRALRERLASLEDCLVAFSGGVDSSVLLHASAQVLGERAVGFVADSPSLPRSDSRDARAFCDQFGIELVVHATAELQDERYARNAPDRCYFCKHTLFTDMVDFARRRGFTTLGFGEITDDARDVRPGARAAGELGITAPLREAGFDKQDVRRYAAEHGIAAADKPASACLASRIPHGTPVTRERLGRIERSEARLKELGLRVLRVRDHGEHARVEVGADELEQARRNETAIREALEFERFRSLELDAYRVPGSIPSA